MFDIAPAGERLLDPEARLQFARDVAWRALNRRDHTVLEVRRVLERKRVEPGLIAAVVEELLAGGWLDDARYAQRFAEDRRRLDGWGPDRIERKLVSLGIDRDHIDAALNLRSESEELEAALEILARRFPELPSTPRDRDRALGVLVRKGYDLELAYDAVRRFTGVAEFDDA